MIQALLIVHEKSQSMTGLPCLLGHSPCHTAKKKKKGQALNEE